jgi:CubicO group peptidase (beta-lactamase class C family)
MKNSVLVVVGVIFVAWASSASCAGHESQIEEYLAACRDLDLFNGSVLVAEGDSIILHKQYGMADVENEIPITPDTRFKIGSTTKQFTTFMIFQLVEEGLLSFDDKITKHLPDYRADTGDRVTMDHLLRHMSGIPSYTSWSFWEEQGYMEHERDEFIREFLSGDLVFEPGSTYRYSNTNSYLLGVIIERVTGESYDANLRRRILEPLGMRNTGAGYSDPEIPNLAVGYIKRVGRYRKEPFVHSSNAFATGDIISITSDFLLWNRAFKPGVILSDTMIEKMFTPYFRINRFYGRAYGWNVYTIRLHDSEELVWLNDYNGELYGHYATITRVPERDYLIVIMSNAGPTVVSADEIVNILHDTPYRMPRVPLKDMLGEIIYEQGVDAAFAAYHKAEAGDSTFHRRSERQINGLGYDLLGLGMVDEALEILKLNTEEHPRSSNVWDSYAEALAAKGDTAAAILNYRKSLDLNSENQNARRMIERLRGR